MQQIGIWTKLFLSCYKTDNKIHKLTSYSLRKRSKSFQNPFLMLFTYIFHTSEDKTVPIFIPISTLLPSFL